jgi:hypothetical protein
VVTLRTLVVELLRNRPEVASELLPVCAGIGAHAARVELVHGVSEQEKAGFAFLPHAVTNEPTTNNATGS